MGLDGKVAIVTGSSRGLGKAIAVGLAKQGAIVVVSARTEIENPKLPGTIHNTVKEIESLGHHAFPIRCDVTDEHSVDDMVQKTISEFGHIDILVNNAAVAFYYPVLETPLKRWELVLRVTLTGTFLCSKAVLPQMIKQGSGSIVNISSGAASERDLGLFKTGAAYGVSKAGIERFTWALAAEVGQYNIAVNCLKPKNIMETEGGRFWLKDAGEIKFESPDRWVRCIIFLASQDAKAVTGTVATDEELCTWHGLE